MNQPPPEINKARVVCFAEVTKDVMPTGATTHRRDGHVLGPAKGLAICQYEREKGFYLFYCDERWDVLSDTFHLTLEDAKHQAEYEYAGISSRWRQFV